MSASSQNTRPIAENNFNKVVVIESPSSPHQSTHQSESCDDEAGEADNENSSDSTQSLPILKNHIERDALLSPDKRYRHLSIKLF